VVGPKIGQKPDLTGPEKSMQQWPLALCMTPIHFHWNLDLHACHQDHPTSKRKGLKTIPQRKNNAPVRSMHRSAAVVLIVENIAKTLARIAMKSNDVAVTASTLQKHARRAGTFITKQ
jgi:hypothetical protein